MPSSMLGIMYVDIMREFRAEASETALMLSLYRGLSFGGCMVGNLIMRYVGEFPCMMVGSFIGSVSFIVAVFAQNVTTVVLLVGVGAGCGFMFPLLLAYSNIGRAFSGKAATQFLTLTAIGGGIGLIITPYITEFLLREYEWRGTCLISGGLFLNLLVIGVLVQLNLPDSPENSKVFNWEDQKAIFKSRAYSLMLFSMVLFGLFGFIEPWFLPDFLVSNGYNQKDAAFLMTVIGTCNLIGRILAGVLEPLLSRTKLMYHWIYIFTLMGLSHAIFPYFIHVNPALILASVIYGITFGMVVSQSAPVILQSLSSDLYPTGLATELTIYGGCTVLGGYVGGLIRDVTGGYTGVFYIASLSAIVVAFSCGILLSVEKLYKRKTKPCVHIPSISTITHL
ncbi:monocarboxylate transporter 13-like [Saccostrea echinata]|uniref:monocarboxylate transporter 13-like n=1 Tax=Saccostrea echinata TaxID=191078 RepID=UPI002A7FAF87|nr:monocarboxylate transporter 13-like [Saccostrea echinata]